MKYLTKLWLHCANMVKMDLGARKPVFRGLHPQSDHAFVIHLVESIISRLATGEILIL